MTSLLSVPPVPLPTDPQIPHDTSEELERAYALEINDDEPEEFTLELGEDLIFTLVGKFITDKAIKFPIMRDTMATIWRPGRGMAIKELLNHTYLFQFFHKIDVHRIIDDEPWSFEQNLLVLARLQPDIPPCYSFG